MRIFTSFASVALVFLSLIPMGLKAQVDGLFEDHPVRHIGPGTMSGRVTSIDVSLGDGTIYAGTASGGLWQSKSEGTTWEPLFDDQDLLSIGAVAIAPSNPDVLWVGTGEGNPRNSHTSGAGIYRSLDGGLNWALMGLENTRAIHRIRIHPQDPKTVFVAAMGSAWGPNAERGVYRTRDGGENWTQVLFENDTTGCAELIMDPSNPDKLFASMWHFHREPWFFTSGGDGSGLHVTHDGGDSWTLLGEDEGLPSGTLGRMGLAMSAADPDIVYALIESEKTGLYRSQDGGANWSLVTTENIGNRPFYYADIHADPSDPDRLYNLYSLVSRSDDGGKNFEVILPYSGAHPDHHAFWIDPRDPDYLIDGNDGGINISRDGGVTWTFVRNLPVGQFYHVNVDDKTPYNVYGGMQDNGSWVAPAYVWHSDGIRSEDWQEIAFGDGFDVVPVPGDAELAYAMSQGGHVYRIHVPTGEMVFIQPNHPDSVALRFHWNAAIALDTQDPDGVYFGSQFVHHSSDLGQSWTIISPDLTTNDPSKQRQAESGGLTIDATKAENYTTILCIAPHPDPSRPDEIWASTDDGRLQRTRDGGKSWIDLSAKLKGLPEGAWLPQIQISTLDPDVVYVVANDYRRNNWDGYLYRTQDSGESWDRIVYGETKKSDAEVLGHVHCVMPDTEVEDLIWLGTEQGLWWSSDWGWSWRPWREGVPAVPVRDIAVQEREADLVLGTFGRGIYVIDNLDAIRQYVRSGEGDHFGDAALTVFAPDAGVQASWARPAGERFRADHFWSAENKPSGLRLRFYVHPDSLENLEALADESEFAIHILDAAGDTVRTLRPELEEGHNSTYWGMDRTGVFWPSRRTREPDAHPRGGTSVLPGPYTAHFAAGGQSLAMAQLSVLPDPRRAPSPATLTAQRAYARTVEAVISRADTAMVRLKTMRRALKLARTITAHQDRYDADSTATAQLEEIDQLADSLSGALDDLGSQFFTPSDFEGYDHVTPRLQGLLWHALSYTDSGVHSPGSNAEAARATASRATTKAEETLVKITEEIFNPWRALMEAYPFSTFGELDPPASSDD
jgi:photosystem II stability/assembly factor-like uncharacterized protein